jgi:hypothetical protein
MKELLPETYATRYLEITRHIEETYKWRSAAKEPLILEGGREKLPNDIEHWLSTVLRAKVLIINYMLDTHEHGVLLKELWNYLSKSSL